MAEHLQITPSGIGILFEDGDKDPETRKGKKRRYLMAALGPGAAEKSEPDLMDLVRSEGEEMPSVTTVLGMLDKAGLVYWSEKITATGCVELARTGDLSQDVGEVIEALGRRKLRHTHVKEEKGKRGTMSHEDLVHLFAGRELPPIDSYPEELRGFPMGLAKCLADLRPEIVQSELMVCSLEHGFAGRLDAHVVIRAKRFPDGTPTPKGVGLWDLKTHDKMPRNAPTKACPEGPIKTPYPEHLFQVGLYEIAGVESGYPATDYQAVVRVDAKGNYDFTVSWVKPEAALAFLPAYRTLQTASPRVKRAAHQLTPAEGARAREEEEARKALLEAAA